MNIQVTHDKGKDEAKRRLEELVQELKGKYSSQIEDFKEGWDGYVNHASGKAKGFAVSGTVEVKDAVVEIELTIPFLLRGFNKKIRAVIEEKVKACILGS